MRQPGRHRSADPRRCRLAQFAAGRRAGEHRAPATAALRPGTDPAENIWEYLRGNDLSNCVQRHHLNRNQRMGTGQDLRRLV
jgi:hypothetical protein